MTTGNIRKIIHVDMDAFFASVEQRDNPDLRGKPVAVGGSGMRGVIAAASYEAREYGVRSAMSSVMAKRKCPRLVFVKHRFDVYKAVSQQVRAIFEDYTDLIEPLSLDEAYLDVTENKKNIDSATQIAREIRARILEETKLTASAGVSYNKFIAKLASDENKPNGMCVIPPEKGPHFVMGLSVRRFHGVGPVTAGKMERFGIYTGADLKAKSLEWMKQHFGSSADYFYAAARGEDHRKVQPHRVRKSVGVERTYSQDLTDMRAVNREMEIIIMMLMERIDRANAVGHTLTLKVKYADFKQVTRSLTQASIYEGEGNIRVVWTQLRDMLPKPFKPIRLLGLTLSGLVDEMPRDRQEQLSLPF